MPGEEKEQGMENLFEKIMAENFLNLERGKPCKFRKHRGPQSGKNPQKLTPRYIIIKMPRIKDNERILKAAWEKQDVTYKEVPIKLPVDFSTETLQARREWQETFQVMKSKGLQPRLLYPVKLSIKMEWEIRNISDKKG